MPHTENSISYQCDICDNEHMYDTMLYYECKYCQNEIGICNLCDDTIDNTNFNNCNKLFSNVFNYIFINNLGQLYSYMKEEHPYYENDDKYCESVLDNDDIHNISNLGITTTLLQNNYICLNCIQTFDIICHPYDFTFYKKNNINNSDSFMDLLNFHRKI